MTCLTGDETGLLKIWDIKRSSGAILKTSYGAQGRTRGIASLAWVDGSTNQALINMVDSTISVYDVADQMMLSAVKREGVVAATAYGMQRVRDRLFVVTKAGRIAVTSYEDTPDTEANKCDAPTVFPSTGSAAVGSDAMDGLMLPPSIPSGAGRSIVVEEHGNTTGVSSAGFSSTDTHFMPATGIVEAAHIQRRYGLIALGGKDNNLKVFSTTSERWDTPYFEAKNVRDHVLDVPYPIHIVGACVVDPNVYAVATAYHEVRFYDRRLSERPVQEYKIDREISRRPTALMQWNSNKFLISEASGDIHLYDTRRGFASRAKLRGGVGSVRHMVKHPGGEQLLAAIGLDRKARIYHVPTGRLLSSIYVKQKGTATLLSRALPFIDNASSYAYVANAKNPERKNRLDDRVWDEMDPVNDEFEDDAAATGKSGGSTPSVATPSGAVRPTKPVTVSASPAPAAPASVPAPPPGVAKRARSAKQTAEADAAPADVDSAAAKPAAVPSAGLKKKPSSSSRSA